MSTEWCPNLEVQGALYKQPRKSKVMFLKLLHNVNWKSILRILYSGTPLNKYKSQWHLSVWFHNENTKVVAFFSMSFHKSDILLQAGFGPKYEKGHSNWILEFSLKTYVSQNSYIFFKQSNNVHIQVIFSWWQFYQI